MKKLMLIVAPAVALLLVGSHGPSFFSTGGANPPVDCSELIAGIPDVVVYNRPILGVDDGVIVRPKINGLLIQRGGPETGYRALSMDCRLVHALADMADVLATYDIVEIIGVSTYSYRCIDGQAAPPACADSALSRHAYGDAIDIHGFVTSSGERLTVGRNWTRDPDGQTSCAAPQDLLHEVFCAVHAAGIFTHHLGPNYDVAHRTHFHFDLAPGAPSLD